MHIASKIFKHELVVKNFAGENESKSINGIFDMESIYIDTYGLSWIQSNLNVKLFRKV